VKRELNILFWNIDENTAIAAFIGKFCDDLKVDVLVLIEDKMNSFDLLTVLNSGQGTYHFCRSNDRGISIYTAFSSEFFDFKNTAMSSNFVNFVEFRFPKKHLLFGGIHLSSKNTLQSETSRAGLAREIVKGVNSLEAKVGHSNTIIVGDFNLNPFELGMYDYDAFNAVMSRDIAVNTHRKVTGSGTDRHTLHHYFYNPMWSFMGDLSKYAPGTYYWYDNSRDNNFRWNTFDQILLRPYLIPNFVEDSVKIIEADLLGRKLIDSSTKTRRKNQIFDHLPIFLTIDLTK